MVRNNYLTRRNKWKLKKLRLAIEELKRQDMIKLRCNIDGLDDFLHSRRVWSKRNMFWLLLFLFCMTMLTYQTHDRVMHYLSYPTHIDVTTKLGDIVLPDLMFCSSNTKEIAKLWNNKRNETGRSKSSHMIRSLMEIPTTDMDELWKATNMTKEIDSVKMKGYSNKTVVLTEINSALGMCSAFKFNKRSSRLFVGKLLTVNIEKIDRRVFKMPTYHIVLSLHDFGKHYFDSQTGSRTKAKINFEISKFILVNSSNNLCSSESQYVDCYRTCLKNLFLKNLTCRFPFLNLKINLPLCKCSRNAYESYEATRNLIETTDPINDCSCRRPCQKFLFNQIIYFDKADDKGISFTLAITNENIKIYEQRYAYDAIALLTDLGGNLGLFLGLSLISLTEVILYFYYVSSKISKKQKIDNIRQFYEKCKKKVDDREKKIKLDGILMKLKLLLVITSTGFTLYLLHCRLNYYRDEPVIKTVSIVQRLDTEFPSITICGEKRNEKMDEAKLQLLVRRNKTCNNITPWQLFNNKVSLKDIWDALKIYKAVNFHLKLTAKSEYISNLTKIIIPLPFGHCLRVNAGRSNLLTAKVQFSLSMFPPRVCYPNLLYFINNPDEEVDILTPLPAQYGCVNKIILQPIKTLKINTKRNPCEVNRNAFLKCRNACLQNNLLRLIDCRLPYMSTANLPPCNITESSHNAHLMYLNNYKSNQKTCKCKEPCENLFYQTVMHVHPIFESHTLVKLQFADSYTETFKEKDKYTTAHFVSDIGSIVGLGFGMSLLSLHCYILQSCNWFLVSIRQI